MNELTTVLLEALKEARGWVESEALACGYAGCTPESCASRRAEGSLTIIDAAIAKATTANSLGTSASE